MKLLSAESKINNDGMKSATGLSGRACSCKLHRVLAIQNKIIFLFEMILFFQVCKNKEYKKTIIL